MKYLMAANALVVSALILGSADSFAQHGPPQSTGQQDRGQSERGQMDVDRDRLRDRDRLEEPQQDRGRTQDRDRDQDRIHTPDFSRLRDGDMFGREVMSAQERNEYRRQLQDASSPQERQRIEAQHRETVEARARAQGVDLAHPGKGIYGGALMSVEERARFREQVRMLDSDEERRQFMSQHRQSMQQRATARGVPFEELEETEEDD